MQHLSVCLVCHGSAIKERYPATFTGTWQEAIPYFLTGRIKVVHGRIMECRDCGFNFTSPQFTADDYARIYAAVRASKAADDADAAQMRFAELARQVHSREGSGLFLDFGCGSGAFLDAMPSYDGVGFEVDADVPGGVSRYGRLATGNILADSLPDIGLMPDSFDFIVAWDMLEHLADPLPQMQRLNTLLKRSGHIYLTVPNGASWAARLSGERWNLLLLEHLWYFTPVTIPRFLGHCGFMVDAVFPFGYPVDVATLFLRLRQTYGRWLPAAPPLLAKLVVRLPIGLMFVQASKAS